MPQPSVPPLSLVAGYVRVMGDAESRLWELCGAWSAEGDQPAARSFFAAQSAFHAWRAEEWRRRLPMSVLLDEVPATESVLPGGWHRVVSSGGEVRADVARLAVWLHLLVPSLVTGLRRCRGGLREVADAGVIRLIRIMGDDLLEQWAVGQSLIADWAGPDSVLSVGEALGERLPVLWSAEV